MVCPLEVIALLVGLQGDPSESVRQRALHLIQVEDVNRATFLDNRFCHGIELASELQWQICKRTWVSVPQNDNQNVSPPVSVMGSLYNACFRQNRKRRVEFLSCLLRRCESLCNITERTNGQTVQALGSPTSAQSPSNKHLFSKKTTVPKEISRLSHIEGKVDFLANTLSYLPYAVQDEPLLIITWLNRNSTVQTEVFLKRFRELLLVCGAVSRKEGAMQGPMDGSALPSKKGRPNSLQTLMILSGSGKNEGYSCEDTLLFDEDVFRDSMNSETHPLSLLADFSCEARCRERLILLKHFLKYAYNLSSSLCTEYSSDGKLTVDKSRRPKRRRSKVVDLDKNHVGGQTLYGEASANSEEQHNKGTNDWEVSIAFTENALKYPYSSITPIPDEGYKEATSDQLHQRSPDERSIGSARNIIRKSIETFNRLVVLQYHGFDNLVHSRRATGENPRINVLDSETITKRKAHSTNKLKNAPKRKRRRTFKEILSDEDDDNDYTLFNGVEDDDEYIP